MEGLANRVSNEHLHMLMMSHSVSNLLSKFSSWHNLDLLGSYSIYERRIILMLPLTIHVYCLCIQDLLQTTL